MSAARRGGEGSALARRDAATTLRSFWSDF